MSTTSKQRLDIILVNKGLAVSRKKQSVLFCPGSACRWANGGQTRHLISPESAIIVEEDPIPS